MIKNRIFPMHPIEKEMRDNLAKQRKGAKTDNDIAWLDALECEIDDVISQMESEALDSAKPWLRNTLGI